MRRVFEQMPPAFRDAELDELEISTGAKWARVLSGYPAIARPFLRTAYKTRAGRSRFWARAVDALEARAPAGSGRNIYLRIKRGKREIRFKIQYKGRAENER